MFETGFLHGGDYNPEQWIREPAILAKDIEYFKKAKINAVTLGVFSWAVLEPCEGEYHIEWLQLIIDKLYKNGIRTILATPSAARPKWLSDKYPEVLRVNENRRRNLFGARHNHCYTSPVYREKIAHINTLLAKTFSENPSILMWHISNEYGGECHCPLCQEAFRDWLKTQYQSINELNDKWATTFWSHTYQSFSQIESPSSLGEKAVHGLNLAWRRFVTHQTTDFAKHEINVLRENGCTQPTTANLMYDFTDINYDILAEVIDVVSWDTYPLWHKTKDIIIANDTGFYHDYMRCLKDKPFILMESCPTSTNWQGISKLKKPGLLENASLHAIAHGADSVLYFQMRQSRGSSEKFHGAVIDHYGGCDTRVFKEVAQTGVDLEKLSEIAGSRTNSKVAIIYDVENRWGIEDSQGPRNDGMFYPELLKKSYRAFKKKGLNVDIISQNGNIENYDVVVAPMLYMLRGEFENKIKTYVQTGGTLIMTYWSGVVDNDDRCYLGGTPHGLNEVLGLRSQEIDALYDDESNFFVPVSTSLFGKNYTCKNLCELVEVTTGEVLMRYGTDFYKGFPAVTKNTYGKGSAYYICADVEESFYDELYSMVLKELSINGPVQGDIPASIEVNTRHDGEMEYVFIQNFANEIVDISKLSIDGILLIGENTKQLKAYETIVLKVTKV